jgi:hypothetical protein
MIKITTKITAITRKLALLNLSVFNKKLRLGSAIRYHKSDDRHAKNWGKTAEFLPEVGECYLSASLYQLEEERVRANAFA